MLLVVRLSRRKSKTQAAFVSGLHIVKLLMGLELSKIQAKFYFIPDKIFVSLSLRKNSSLCPAALHLVYVSIPYC